MSFLGNIFHSIGNLIDGGNNNKSPSAVTTTTQAPRQQVTIAPKNVGLTSTPLLTPTSNLKKVNPPSAVPTTTQAPKKVVAPPSNGAPLAPTGVNNLGGSNALQKLIKVAPAPSGPNLGPNAPTGNINWLDEAKANALGIAHVATSVPEGISSLVDTVTPGKGTNRVTQALQKLDKNISTAGKNAAIQSGDPESYNIVQPAAQAATLIGPGDLIKVARGGVTAASDAERAAEAAGTSRLVTGAQKTGKIISDIPGTLTKIGDNAVTTGKAVVSNLTKPTNWTLPDAVEVTDGVASVNPTKDADAAAALNAGTPPPPPEPVSLPITDTAMNDHESAALKALDTSSKNRVLTPTEQTMRTALQAKSDAIDAINNPKPVSSVESGSPQAQPAPTSQPTPVTPAETAPVSTVSPESTPQGTPPGQSPVSIENSSSPGSVTQTDNTVNTAKNAPNVRKGFAKALKSVGKDAGDPTTRDVLSNADLTTAAKNTVDATPDSDLITKYSGVPDLSKAEDLAHASQSLPRLAQLSKDADPDVAESASRSIDNILEGAEKGQSEAGRLFNYGQTLYDTLPKEAKISSAIRVIDKARDAAGLPKIADDVELRSDVEAQLDRFISKGEGIKKQMADLQDSSNLLEQGYKAGQVSANDVVKESGALARKQAALELKATAQNTETARYYQKLMPGKANLEKTANFARTSMLTAPSGRINNVLNVGGNTLYELGRSVLQAPLNRIYNGVSGRSGATADSSLVNSGLRSGFASGLRKVKSALGGNQDIKELALPKNGVQANRTMELARTSDNRGLNKIANVTHALVKAPSETFGGAIRDAKVVQLARQAGKAEGYKGDDLKVYTAIHSFKPTPEMVQKAQSLQDTASHMNKNPLADIAGAMFKPSQKGAGNLNGALGLIKNTFLPFPKYAATFTWNTLTDRNVVADTIRMGTALKKGDPEGFTRALAGAAVDGTAMGVGFHLAQQGVITNKNAEGYNDDGAYLHIGNRYIPLGVFGVNAEGLIAGTAMYNATQSSHGNPLEVFGKTVGDTAFNTVKTAGAQNLVGAGDQGLTSLQQAFTGSDGVDPADALSVLGGQFAGQFIPGISSDTNSVLNQTNLDPSHTNALTKVTKTGLTPSGNPTTAKNIPASELKTLENRVPGLSQKLPRNTTTPTAANDFIDRITRGDHAGPDQVAAAATLQKTQNVSAVDKAANIPDPNGVYAKGDSFDDAVENRIENKNYDAAISGLQQQLSKVQSGKDVTSKETDPIEKQIAEVKVLKAGNYDPSIRDLYSKTSVTEWRDMGDPTNAAYDPAQYKLLYNYDASLASAGASGNTNSDSDAKYTVKAESASESAKSAKNAAGGALGTAPSFSRISFGDLAPKKITDSAATIPTIQQMQAGDLIKKRAISVR